MPRLGFFLFWGTQAKSLCYWEYVLVFGVENAAHRAVAPMPNVVRLVGEEGLVGFGFAVFFVGGGVHEVVEGGAGWDIEFEDPAFAVGVFGEPFQIVGEF